MIKDSLGQTVSVGDQIAYAVRSGNSGALNHYIVEGFTPEGRVKARSFSGNGAARAMASRVSTLMQPESHAVITKKAAK